MHAIGFMSSLTLARALPPRHVPLSAHSAPAPERDSFHRLRFGENISVVGTDWNPEPDFLNFFRHDRDSRAVNSIQLLGLTSFADLRNKLLPESRDTFAGKKFEAWNVVANALRHSGFPADVESAEKIYDCILDSLHTSSLEKATALLGKAKNKSHGKTVYKALIIGRKALEKCKELPDNNEKKLQIMVWLANQIVECEEGNSDSVQEALHLLNRACTNANGPTLVHRKVEALLGLGNYWRMVNRPKDAKGHYQAALGLIEQHKSLTSGAKRDDEQRVRNELGRLKEIAERQIRKLRKLKGEKTDERQKQRQKSKSHAPGGDRAKAGGEKGKHGASPHSPYALAARRRR